MIRILFSVLLLTIFGCKNESILEKPKISFSFDDGSTQDFPGYENSKWNQWLFHNWLGS